MQEEQAIELIASAVFDYHKNNKGESNAEEMARSIRKVNHYTKKLKRILKKTLEERRAMAKDTVPEPEQGIASEQVHLDIDDGEIVRSVSGRNVRSVRMDLSAMPEARPKSFAEQISACSRDLRLAMEWIGEDELREVDKTKYRRKVGLLEWQTLENPDDVEDFSIKRVREDMDEVLEACRESDIGERDDKKRQRAAGMTCRVIKRDPTHPSLKCRVPGLGDIWFGCRALEHLRSPEADFSSLKQAKAAGERGGATEAGGDGDGEGEEDLQDTLLRAVNDLETEKRFGEQTVTEAINAVSELKWQQVKEKTDRSKLHQKIQGLKKKVISRHREHRKLAQETARQEERLEIVTKSRDEYMELRDNLMAEKQRLERKMGLMAIEAKEHGMNLGEMIERHANRDFTNGHGNGYGNGHSNGHGRGNGHTNGHTNAQRQISSGFGSDMYTFDRQLSHGSARNPRDFNR
jgi:hypothetical protein